MHPSKHLTPKEGFAIPNRQDLSRNVPVAISQKCGKHVRHLMFEFCDRACLHTSWVGDDIAIPGSVASAAKSIGPTHCHPQPLEPPLIILVGPRLSIWLAGWLACLVSGRRFDKGFWIAWVLGQM